MKEITKIEHLLDVIHYNGSKDLYLFKHSTTCPISASAFDEFKRFSDKHPEADCYFIDLWAHRDVSNRLAEIAQIKHESPQVILYFQGRVIWNASHRAIHEKSLEQHLSNVGNNP